MPWRETREMDEKLRFVTYCLEGRDSMLGLCRGFGISRQTGYELLRRYRESGVQGLEPRSRAPQHRAHAMAAEVVAAVLAEREAHPLWGPKKLRAVLQRRTPELAWPATSSMGDLLRREGLVERRPRHRAALPVERPFAAVTGPNALWCADFKGWFRTGDNARCDPLTVSDAHSRYILACRIVPETIAAAAPVFSELFRAHGLPRAIRTDNGAPFAAGYAAGGLSRLAVPWLRLGIVVERITPGSPQQNGRHERFHRSLKDATLRPPAATRAEQQVRFDDFVRGFNEERPHEALGQTPPATHWQRSERQWDGRVPEPSYDGDHAVRRVTTDGAIRWGGVRVFVSEALAGELVGVAETKEGHWVVRFCALDLGLLDCRTHKLTRFAPPRPGRRKAGEQEEKTV